jgi:hypothetical protein
VFLCFLIKNKIINCDNSKFSLSFKNNFRNKTVSIGCSFNILVPMEIFCFCEGMASFELPVSKIRVELSILTFAFRQVYYCLLVFTLEQKTF